MKIIDVRSSDGQLAILGGALLLPTSATSVASPTIGSIRWNATSQVVEFWSGSSWSSVFPSTAPYDMYGSYLGQPSATQLLWRIVMVRQITLPVNLTGSQAICLTAPTNSSLTLSISRNGTSIGTIDYLSNSTVGSFTFAAQVVFNAGDILQVNGPASTDSTFSTPSWSFVGTKIT